jgi:hypothetical protein
VLSTAMGVLLEPMDALSIKDQTILFMPILIVIALSLESKTGLIMFLELIKRLQRFLREKFLMIIFSSLW